MIGNMAKARKLLAVILFLVVVLGALLIYRVANGADYPNAPEDAGTLILNGGDCNRRTATWTHGGDYELYVLPVTSPVCWSLNAWGMPGGQAFEHPYSFYSTSWNGSQWIETFDNTIKYPVSHCYEMPGGVGWGGQQMIIKHVSSGALYFKPVDNAAPGWRCERVWLPKVAR